VPAGNFSTNTVEIRVFDNGEEMKDAHFTLYLANGSVASSSTGVLAASFAR